MLLYFGLNYDLDRGIKFLTDATIDTNSDPPSSVFQPAAVKVVQDPRGEPAKPLYMGVTFPIQPKAILVDRHGRMVNSFVREMKIQAAIDENIFPNDLDNPLTLTGFRNPTISPITGFATWDDLEITAVIDRIFLNFSSVYITPFNQRLVLTGTSRFFSVLEPPPRPVEVYIRIPLHPALVAFLALLGASMLGVTAFSWTTILKWLHTTKAKAELDPRRRKRFHRGDQNKGKDDGGVAYMPNKDLDKDDNEEEQMNDSDEEAQVTEEENVVAIEPPPPLYSDKNIPGIGPAFITAFGQLENQLQELDDDEIDEVPLPLESEPSGNEKRNMKKKELQQQVEENRRERQEIRNEVEDNIRRYYHAAEPEVIAAQRAAAAAALAAEENRSNILAHRIDVSVMGHYLFSIETGRILGKVWDVLAPKTKAEREADKRLADTARRVSIIQDVRIANLAHQYRNTTIQQQDRVPTNDSAQDSIDRISEISDENGTNPKIERTGSSSGTPLHGDTPHNPVTDDEDDEHTRSSKYTSSSTASSRRIQRFAWTQVQAPEIAPNNDPILVTNRSSITNKPLMVRHLPEADGSMEYNENKEDTHQEETIVQTISPSHISSSSYTSSYRPLSIRRIPTSDDDIESTIVVESKNTAVSPTIESTTPAPTAVSTSRFLSRGSISLRTFNAPIIEEVSETKNEIDTSEHEHNNNHDKIHHQVPATEILPGSIEETN